MTTAIRSPRTRHDGSFGLPDFPMNDLARRRVPGNRLAGVVDASLHHPADHSTIARYPRVREVAVIAVNLLSSTSTSRIVRDRAYGNSTSVGRPTGGGQRKGLSCLEASSVPSLAFQSQLAPGRRNDAVPSDQRAGRRRRSFFGIRPVVMRTTGAPPDSQISITLPRGDQQSLVVTIEVAIHNIVIQGGEGPQFLPCPGWR